MMEEEKYSLLGLGFSAYKAMSNHPVAFSQPHVIHRDLWRSSCRPMYLRTRTASYAFWRFLITSPAKESFSKDPVGTISTFIHQLFVGAWEVSLSIIRMLQAETPEQVSLQLIWGAGVVPLVTGRIAEFVAIRRGEVVKDGGTT